jgi:hypothetical protein
MIGLSIYVFGLSVNIEGVLDQEKEEIQQTIWSPSISDASGLISDMSGMRGVKEAAYPFRPVLPSFPFLSPNRTLPLLSHLLGDFVSCPWKRKGGRWIGVSKHQESRICSKKLKAKFFLHSHGIQISDSFRSIG